MEEVPLGVLGDNVTRPLSRSDRSKIIQALRQQDRDRRLKEAQHVIEAKSETALLNR
jgi:hypothetical protein